MTGLRVLVVTIVHQPLDARIHARQIRAMRDAGWAVTYAAPWAATTTNPDPGLDTVDLPRAVGLQRLQAVRAARRMLREKAQTHDLVLLHDPELLLSAAGLRRLPPLVWDVHEDVAASLSDRGWLPAWARPALRACVLLLERWVERRHHLILAEDSYADRFHRPHPVVRNLPWIPDEVQPPGPGRAVYLGRISRSRGADTLLAVADLIAPHVTMELVGPADADIEPLISRADSEGRIHWHGFIGNEEALDLMEGATVGVSLLRDEPNFRGSLPTKVAEYMARGLPVVTTPLPEAVRLLEDGRGGTVVPFNDARAAAEAIMAYHENRDKRMSIAEQGRAIVADHSWQREAAAFLQHLEQLCSYDQSGRH